MREKQYGTAKIKDITKNGAPAFQFKNFGSRRIQYSDKINGTKNKTANNKTLGKSLCPNLIEFLYFKNIPTNPGKNKFKANKE
jgi:hypothetical protein